MADNSIRVKRIEMNMTQSELASHMPDGVNAMCLSYVENGKLLPTRDGMNALCSLFHCSPTDLYRPEDLNLLGTVVPEPETSAEIRVRAKSDSGSRQHGDSVEFRVWLRPSEKDMLENAVNALGYRSMAEWFREAYRTLIAREKQLRIPKNSKSE